MTRSGLRIFLGLTEVSGYYAQLRKGFVALGLDCVHIPMQSHRFAYEEDSGSVWQARVVRSIVQRRVRLPEAARLRRATWLLPLVFARVLLFAWVVRNFDVLILGGGSSFFRFLDLPLLRLFGRRVIYVFHGTDARPAYLDGGFYLERHAEQRRFALDPPALDDDYIDAFVAATRMRYRDTRWVERHADVVVCGPGFGQLLRKPFVNFAAIGIPFAPAREPVPAPRESDGNVRILHATSDMVGRGTRHTRRIIEELQAEGLPIEFVILTGQSNTRVLDELQKCDFVVDGQWADTPMAGFATEAARFGKPVVMAGYYAEFVAHDMRADTIPPTCFTVPQEMKTTIRRLVVDSAWRQQVGTELREFVLKHWTPEAVAAKFLELLEGPGPEHWRNDPLKNRYFLGGGISAARIAEIVRAIVARHGERALLLDHNPELRDALLRFVQAEQEAR